MIHLAVALIVVALIGADLAADLWLPDGQSKWGWDVACTLALSGAVWWFWLHAG